MEEKLVLWLDTYWWKSSKKCGDNVVIKENVYISNIEKLELGDNISIHPMCYFECSGGLMIGNNVSIAHSSSILTSTHTYSDFNLPINIMKS